MSTEVRKTGIYYRMLKQLVDFLFNNLMYKRVYYLNKKNIPPDGTPLVIVSNHQNGLVDAAAILLSFDSSNRKPHFFAPAKAFKLNKYISRLLHYLGVLPDFENKESILQDDNMFQEGETLLAAGEEVTVFPEADPQGRHRLGNFSTDYLKMAFEAAEKTSFAKEVFILPCCNHYTSYFDLRGDMLIKFGTPLSLKPYYETYKTQPRTAEKEAGRKVREQISDMMLNHKDLENYIPIDFLRRTFGEAYARKHSLPYEEFPDQLEADKKFTASIEASEQKQSLCDNAIELKELLEKGNITYDTLEDIEITKGSLIRRCATMAILSPLWIFSLWPHIFIYLIPKHFAKRKGNKMFESSFLLAFSAIATVPLFYGISFILVMWSRTIVMAAMYICVLPLLAIFAWNYYSKLKQLQSDIRYYKYGKNNADMMRAADVEKEILDKIAKLRR